MLQPTRSLSKNDRVVHGKAIMAIFAGLFLKNSVKHWLEELEKAGVPCGPKQLQPPSTNLDIASRY